MINKRIFLFIVLNLYYLSFFVNSASGHLVVQVICATKPISHDGILIRIFNEGKVVGKKENCSDVKIKLSFDKLYLLECSKDGYVSKSVIINTNNITSERKALGFPPIKFKLKLSIIDKDSPNVPFGPIGAIN